MFFNIFQPCTVQIWCSFLSVCFIFCCCTLIYCQFACCLIHCVFLRISHSFLFILFASHFALMSDSCPLVFLAVLYLPLVSVSLHFMFLLFCIIFFFISLQCSSTSLCFQKMGQAHSRAWNRPEAAKTCQSMCFPFTFLNHPFVLHSCLLFSFGSLLLLINFPSCCNVIPVLPHEAKGEVSEIRTL